MANVMAETQYLTNAPIQGDTPTYRAARAAVDLLRTAITQQDQYSQGVPYIHGTPFRSVSRQEESPAIAASGSQRHHKVPLTPPGGPRIMVLPAPNTNQRVEPAVQLPTQEPN